jgi:hypothetical protein
MLGFLFGIIYANLGSKDMIMYSGILSDSFFNQYVQMQVDPKEYIWYVLEMRLLPFGMIAALGCIKRKRIVAVLTLVWTGFLGGMMMSLAVLKMGVKGIILCLIALIPHMIFYIASYVILLWYLYTWPKSQWNGTKTVSMLLFLVVGILLETYVNPGLMQAFIRTL